MRISSFGEAVDWTECGDCVPWPLCPWPEVAGLAAEADAAAVAAAFAPEE